MTTTAVATGVEIRAKKFVLQEIFDKAASVVPTRDTTLPVLKNFLVEASETEIKVRATDLELSVIVTTDLVEVLNPGRVLFPAARLLSVLREAEDGDVLIAVEGVLAHITIGRTVWDIRLAEAKDYPDAQIPAVEGLTFTEVNRHDFTRAIESVRYAASTNANRQSLMLIDFSRAPDGVTKATACDGVRLQTAPLGDVDVDLQIPIGAVDDLVKMLRSTDVESIEISSGDTFIVFRIGADVFVANKSTAAFPDVAEMMLRPALTNNDEVTIDRIDLLDVIRRVRVTADQETSGLLLDLAPGTLTVASRDKYGNAATETLDVGWEHEARTLVVNHVFLTQMLQMVDAKVVHLYLGPDRGNRRSPLLLKDAASGIHGLIMQMRLDWLS